ncbi:phosphoadenosine phosphosulfate reductase [Streptomyces sp. NRRL F-5630]|uniref:phosphoadenosine phosphosulfate reductase n=1 Tax=Streptomyces sp. NRRL F-5630 TaxID=1463864 RepID=UPI003EBD9DE5
MTGTDPRQMNGGYQLDLFGAGPEPAPVAGPAPAPGSVDLYILNLSGGKDGLRAAALALEHARASNAEERVYTVHASLGPLEWPGATANGTYYPGSSELAALHSRALGVPPERHIEVRRTRELEGHRVPYDLLTFIAERGDWPWLGKARWCTGDWKTALIYGAFTSLVRFWKKDLGRPVVCANVLGIRADESRDRKNRPALRTTTDNSARIVHEWSPAHHLSTQAVKDWTDERNLPHQWCYDSRPGAGDWQGSSRCSCSLCVLASGRDLLLGVRRRPQLAELYAHVERVRGVPFNPNTSMAALIERAGEPGAPDPGIVIEDEGPEFDALKNAVDAALRKPPKRQRYVPRSGPVLPLCADCPEEAEQ